MIKIIDLKKKFGEHIIEYDDIVFENNKSVLILGASGSGKSTLLNMIAGVTDVSDGEIFVDEVDIVCKPQKYRDKLRTHEIGYIYQDFKLIEDMTVEDNIRILEICGIKSINLAEIVQDLGISDKLKRRVRNLSGGEKQRVAIARTLVKNPQIMLADEPTGSLNYEIGDIIVKKLIECSKGKILIVVSHDTRLIDHFDVVIDLNQKKGEIKNV